jgi:hypothetical protein
MSARKTQKNFGRDVWNLGPIKGRRVGVGWGTIPAGMVAAEIFMGAERKADSQAVDVDTTIQGPLLPAQK